MQFSKDQKPDSYTFTLAGWEAKALLRELGRVPRAKKTGVGDILARHLREAALDAGETVRTRRGAPAKDDDPAA